MTEDLYQEVLLEAAENPQNFGTLSNFTHEFDGFNASCGDKIHVQLQVDVAGTISDIAWQGDGCIISQAAMSAVSEFVKNKPVADLEELSLADILELLHFDTISPGRIKCCMLGLESVRKALG
ncbi:MAG: iron-sulfur cluster assembly scaffold protein [Candidatus Pacebacteria bacterium]|nr:iron-sulfur cluster assembly scaffold protein [Candidatus Paceibacterota bacterium]PIR63642.1 MAG: hypothetical protein COU64_03535 [Candidatus Pacebacteria bacterium CG10_big_fil_rev_8_21_14_0_10_40_26]PIZ78744.1 MAG: hypothetical protein COY01_03905 [Candidatus Pacebacteria bacterium CG_4_10_14_0_2_um_filter_40_20]PJA68404.1 MAG: hypothetical protein CO156_05410 [Candidatus Pacebacteria bacterium CG_4_9_14_3_um_filter_40_12]PJC41266.1 MAG: hypothetical protein CO041_05480 [Candidatus Paceb